MEAAIGHEAEKEDAEVFCVERSPLSGRNLYTGDKYLPVSYTHLDVYKRQGTYCDWKLCFINQ